MRLALAAPTYGHAIPAAVKAQRVALMTASNSGIKWAGDCSSDRMGWSASRNAASKGAIDAGADGIVWIDDDVIVPPQAILWLTEHGDDFVTGVYCQRGKPHYPMIARFNGDGFQWAKRVPKNVYGPVDGCGFGCVYTSAKLINALGPDPFTEKDGFSEDLSFCRRATAAGFTLYCDTRVMCGHLQDPQPATYELFLEQPEAELVEAERRQWEADCSRAIA